MKRFPQQPFIPKTVSLALILIFLLSVLSPPAGVCLSLFDRAQGEISPGITFLFETGRVWRLLGRSLILAFFTALLSGVFGLFLGLSIFSLSYSSRIWAFSGLLLPVVLSPPVIGVGAMWVFGPAGVLGEHLPWNLTQGLEGPVILLSLTCAPLIAFMVFAGRSRIGGEMISAARLNVSETKTFYRITLPLLLPYVACGLLLVFVLSLFNYTIPSLCRQNVLSVELLLRFSAYFDLKGAAFLSAMLALVGLFVLGALRMLIPFATHSEGAEEVKLKPLSAGALRSPLVQGRKKKLWACLSIAVFLALSAGIPVWGQLTRLPPAGRIPAILNEALPSLKVTLTTSALGAALSLFLGSIWALQAGFGRFLRGAFVDILGILPLVLPNTLLGIGLIYVCNNRILGSLLDTVYVLSFAKGLVFSPYSFIILLVSIRLLPPAELEATALSQRSLGAVFFHLIFRRLRLPVAGSLLVCFCLGMGENDLALLLSPPGTKPLPVEIYNLYHFGAPGDVAVISLLLASLTIAVGALWLLILRVARRPRTNG